MISTARRRLTAVAGLAAGAALLAGGLAGPGHGIADGRPDGGRFRCEAEAGVWRRPHDHHPRRRRPHRGERPARPADRDRARRGDVPGHARQHGLRRHLREHRRRRLHPAGDRQPDVHGHPGRHPGRLVRQPDPGHRERGGGRLARLQLAAGRGRKRQPDHPGPGPEQRHLTRPPAAAPGRCRRTTRRSPPSADCGSRCSSTCRARSAPTWPPTRQPPGRSWSRWRAPRPPSRSSPTAPTPRPPAPTTPPCRRSPWPPRPASPGWSARSTG